MVSLILPKKYFRAGSFEGLISHLLTIFNSKNVERYRKLVKKIFEGSKMNLKKLRAIIEDVTKLGKEAYSMKDLHRYSFEPVKKRCSISALLTG